MKKIYILLCAITLTLSTNAQTPNMAVELESHLEGEEVEGGDLEFQFILRNWGADRPAGTIIHVGYRINNIMYSISNGFNGGVVSAYTTDSGIKSTEGQRLETGKSLDKILEADVIRALGNQSGNICVQASVGINGFNTQGEPDDTDWSDNSRCIFYVVPPNTMSIGENNFLSISAFPNPATDVINFNLGTNEASLINILDISGRIVETINVVNTIETLNTSNFDSGVYFYQVQSEGKVVKTSKFSVQ